MTPTTELPNQPHAADRSHGWLLALIVSLAASLLIVAPFFWLGSASGHDFEFHVASWLDVADQWKTGILFPRWTEWANHGFGEPRFLFYPPLSWMIAPLLSFVVPWVYVPVAFIVLVQTFAGLSAFTLARRMLPERAALFSAFCYAANPNALLMVYRRSDFAELLASAFFPLVVLTALQLAGVIENRCGSRVRTLALFSAAFAAVWLSNAPAGVIATYSVTLLFGWGAATEKSWKPVWHGASGIALCFGLSGFYLVPAIYEQRWVNIGGALSSGLRPSQNFLYTVIDDPEHTLFNYLASTVAIATIVVTGIAAVAARRAAAEYRLPAEGKKIWGALVLLAAVATALMLQPTLFVWEVLPELRFVQFPWRWMSILSVAFAYFLAVAAARRRFRRLWITAVTAMLLVIAVRLAEYAWWDEDDVPTLQAGIAEGKGFEGMDEYDPTGDDHYNLPEAAPRVAFLPLDDSGTVVPQPTVQFERWTAEDKAIRVVSPKAVLVELRLLNYPAWHAEVNGKAVRVGHAADSGQMVVTVPAGESRVTLHFARTEDRTLGFLLSIVSLIVALALFVWPVRM